MNIAYSIVYSERKNIRIIIERDRQVVVKAPLHTSEAKVAELVQSKQRLIQQKIGHNQKYPLNKPAKEFVSGESLLYLGQPYKLYITDEPITGVVFDSKFFISRENQPRANVLFKDWYMQAANEVILPRAKAIADQIGVAYNNINILDLKFRWGSCTPKDNIHFNWRLIKAPVPVIEYIVIHELTHLLEANHTSEFWNRVAVQSPHYSKAKNWLKEFGHELEIDF